MERFVAENQAVVKAQRGEELGLQEKEAAMRRQFAFSFVKQREHLKVLESLVSAVTEELLQGGQLKTAWYEQLLLEQAAARGQCKCTRGCGMASVRDGCKLGVR